MVESIEMTGANLEYGPLSLEDEFYEDYDDDDTNSSKRLRFFV